MTWKQVWDELATKLPTVGLQSLKKALETDDPSLIQGQTYTNDDLGWITGACAIGYCFWKADVCATVNRVFSDFCRVYDASRFDVSVFMEWFDTSPRERVRQELLPAVNEVLEKRNAMEKSVGQTV